MTSALQHDSESRLARYQALKEEAQQRGDAKDARSWAKAFADERRNLEVIKRVEHINALGVLDHHFIRKGSLS